MKTKTRGKSVSVTDENVVNKIYLIRNKRVMLDSDLAELYGVETRVLNQAVKRNLARFPDDFMFVLKVREWQSLRSQFVTSNENEDELSRGGRRFSPTVFTEQGVAMLSSILKSNTAIKVNIQIIRIFTRMRELLLTNKGILLRMEQLEKKMLRHGYTQKNQQKEIQYIFSILKELIHPQVKPIKRMGFKGDD